MTRIRYLRLRSYGLLTPESRADERMRLAAWSSLANLASRAMAMLLMVASVQMTIGYLGQSRFGLWMTMLSFAAMLSFLDLGVGNAMTNIVARAAAASADVRPTHAVAPAIGAGLGVLAMLGIASACVLALLGPWIPWQTLLSGSDNALRAEAQRAWLVFSAGFGALLITGGVQKIFLGLQQAAVGHVSAAVCSGFTIVALFFAARAQAGVPTLLGIVLGGQALPAVPLLLVLLHRRQLLPRVQLAWIRTFGPQILRTGGLFLALQIGTMIGWGSDLLIISSVLGPAEAGAFALAQRLFQFATIPTAILNQPLWGAYADAHARGDRAFIRRMLRQSLTLTLAFTATVAAVLALLHGPIVTLWTGGVVSLAPSLVLLYALWATLEATATSASMYLNGTGVLRPQLWAVLTFCVISIPLKFTLVSAVGLPGSVGATIVAWIIAVPVLYALLFRQEVTQPLRKD